jgi:transcriptional regulator with XRE-family HTH domain
MSFHEKLRRLTATSNCAEVSRQLGLSRTALSEYLNKGCTPRADIAFRLARVLSVSLDWLMDDAAGWPPVRVDMAEPASPRPGRRRTKQVA